MKTKGMAFAALVSASLSMSCVPQSVTPVAEEATHEGTGLEVTFIPAAPDASAVQESPSLPTEYGSYNPCLDAQAGEIGLSVKSGTSVHTWRLGVRSGFGPDALERTYATVCRPSDSVLRSGEFGWLGSVHELRWAGANLPEPARTGVDSLPVESGVRIGNAEFDVHWLADSSAVAGGLESPGPVRETMVAAVPRPGTVLDPALRLYARVARSEWSELPGPWFPLEIVASTQDLGSAGTLCDSILEAGAKVELEIQPVRLATTNEAVVVTDVGEVQADGTVSIRPGVKGVTKSGWNVDFQVRAVEASDGRMIRLVDQWVWRSGSLRPTLTSDVRNVDRSGSYISSISLVSLDHAVSLEEYLGRLEPGPLGDAVVVVTHLERQRIDRHRVRVEIGKL